MYRYHLLDPAELIEATVQVVSQGEEEVVAMMKAIAVEGTDLISGSRHRCNAMLPLPPGYLVGGEGAFGTRDM